MQANDIYGLVNQHESNRLSVRKENRKPCYTGVHEKPTMVGPTWPESEFARYESRYIEWPAYRT